MSGFGIQCGFSGTVDGRVSETIAMADGKFLLPAVVLGKEKEHDTNCQLGRKYTGQ